MQCSTPTIIHTIAELRQHISAARQARATISLVPTMGNLHAGHIALVDKARQHGTKPAKRQCVVVSIFVNPTQFGANEDFGSYPRTLEADVAALAGKADVVFAPSVAEMYPNLASGEISAQSRYVTVSVPDLTETLCGAKRPGHFDGVTTVVTKLFNAVTPDVAVFGKKDYQQLAALKRMAHDLNMPIEIIGVDTVRADDGLALSSRNQYLSDAERAIAPLLQQTLQQLGDNLMQTNENWQNLTDNAVNALENQGFNPDYLTIRRQHDLQQATAGDTELVILVAAWLGKARLLDNLEVNIR